MEEIEGWISCELAKSSLPLLNHGHNACKLEYLIYVHEKVL